PAASASRAMACRSRATASGTSTTARSNFAASATTLEAPRKRSAKRSSPSALRPASKQDDETLGRAPVAPVWVRRRRRRRYRLLPRLGLELVLLHHRRPARP